ncbi:TPA: hypothetical protein N2D16_002783 [Clostridium botulinum]|nr:hypothetical protein [Clostridium sporogenes]HCL4447178.1 hypothetical protein [Clostridium botulinum]
MNNIPKYYVVELIENVNNTWNSRVYNKGVRVAVWQDNNTNCYWTVNTGDNFKINCAKKLYEFTGQKV